MKTPVLLLSTLSLSALAAEPTTVNSQITDTATQSNQTAQLDTVNVTADFRQLDLMQIPSSITVVGEEDIQNRNADHLESVLSLAPNVNFASGASRARYFQIRGIGERSQFIDPVNPSVGLIIDGIDMTGLGGAATLFDIEQVEILRGPQGTAFGANALAGAINIKSKQPTKETEGYVQGKIGNYNTLGLGAAISGSLTDNIQARFAINQIKSDGYMENIHLNRDDTNNIDEVVARAQVAWQVNESNDLNISLLKTDINNGYDAFSLDNNRNTYSNKPGQDTQDTSALSIKWENKLSDSINLELLASGSNTDSIYSYDEDWAYGEYTYVPDVPDYQADPCDLTQGPCLYTIDGYSTEDYYFRENDRQSIDFRLLSGTQGKLFNSTTDWILGITSQNRDESLIRDHTDPDKDVSSNLNIQTHAVYSELNTQISQDTKLTYGVRLEDWNYKFSNSNNIFLKDSETLTGGKVTLESYLNLNHMSYVTLAKGYKAGGVNSNTDLNESLRKYKTETNYTIETGLKSNTFDNNLQSRIAIFYILREEQQVKQSFGLLDDENKPYFLDYIANAAEANNYGVELETSYALSNNINWNTSLGYLKTEFTDFSFEMVDPADETRTITIDKDGRELAHAPQWSLSSSINIQLTNQWSTVIEIEGKDAFYFSDSHDVQSNDYALLHAKLEYTNKNLNISLDGRNLTDKDHTNRGFWFGKYGNDPRKFYAPEPYTQLGAPRLISLSVKYNF